jgi:RND family efflux transporter MFP subunit
MNQPKPLFYLAALPCIVLLAGCGRGNLPELPAPTVEVVPVQERTIQDFVILTGRTEAVESVAIRSRVSGYLRETFFKDGQQVKAGDELFLIDPRPYQADVASAEADFKSAEADVILANNEFLRAKGLLEKKAISTQEFENKSAALLSARARLSSAQARLDAAKLNLEFTRIVAPIDGQTSEATISVGNLITPQMQDPLTTIVSINPIHAYAEIDERLLLRFIRAYVEKHGREDAPDSDQPGERTPVAMQLADETGFPHHGFIDFSDNQISPETGAITIRGVFEDDEGILLPGYFVRLRLASSPEYAAVLVPDEAIGIDQGQRFVYVVGADDLVEYRPVTPGAIQEDGWRAVEGQLQAGERVIVEGMMKVRPGQEVDTRPWHRAEAAAPESTPAAATEEGA